MRNFTEERISTLLNKNNQSLYEERTVEIDLRNSLSNEIQLMKESGKVVVCPQCCSVPMHIDDMLQEWKNNVTPGIKINEYGYINTLLLAGDQTI
jgi:4-hydroxy-3-methylbut-2-en-1-yl diphosphate synthase IspG/GcpE